MHFRIVICCCLALFAGILGKKSRIIGGIPATIADFPHLVSIRKTILQDHVCAGSIISRWNILTAAHCLIGFDNVYHQLRVFTASSSSRNIYGNRFRIQTVYFHPEVRNGDPHSIYKHDIAVIQLQTMIIYNNLQYNIALPTRPPRTNNLAMIAGWGSTNLTLGYMTSTYLNKVGGTILQHIDCNPHVPIILDYSKFCTFYNEGRGICAGDEGGSVITNGELYGIVSLSYGCAQGIPDVHTAVYYYLDFIRRHTNN